VDNPDDVRKEDLFFPSCVVFQTAKRRGSNFALDSDALLSNYTKMPFGTDSNNLSPFVIRLSQIQTGKLTGYHLCV